MFEKNAGTFDYTCDFCSNYLETHEEDFFEAVDFVKAQGWRLFKENGEWHHKCDVCNANPLNAGDFLDER